MYVIMAGRGCAFVRMHQTMIWARMFSSQSALDHGRYDWPLDALRPAMLWGRQTRVWKKKQPFRNHGFGFPISRFRFRIMVWRPNLSVWFLNQPSWFPNQPF